MTAVLNRSLYTLICLIPITLITGPFLPDHIVMYLNRHIVCNKYINFKKIFYLLNKFSLFFLLTVYS